MFYGNAKEGDAISLNDDFTKYKFLIVLTGTQTGYFGGELLAPILSKGNSMYIYASKIYANTYPDYDLQFHVTTFNVIDTNNLSVRCSLYKQFEGSTLYQCYVKDIYGIN